MTLAVGYVATKQQDPALGSPWPGRELGQVRRTVRQAATLPLATLLVVQWLVLAGRGVPETDLLPARGWWLTQLSMVSVADHPLGVTLLVLASAALAVLVRRGQHLGRAWLALPAAVGTVVALVLLLAQAVVGLGGGALAVLVLLLWLASAWWAVAHAVVAGLAPRRAVTSRTGAVLVALWVLLLPGPLAVGRLLLAPDLRAEAVALAANSEGLRFAALLTSVSGRLTAFGMLLGLVVWLAYQCWPRGTRRPLRWYAALFVGLVALLELWWTTPTLAEKRVTELRYGTPVDELHFACATWVYPPAQDAPAETPTETVAVTGAGCSRVTAYVGFRQTGTTATDVSVSPVALRRPAVAGSSDDETSSAGSTLPTLPRVPTGRTGSTGPAGEPVPMVGARYGDVVVLAGTNRFDHTADQVVAVSVHGGPALWRFVCGDKREVRARFAGGQPDPASAATNPGEPGDVVVLTCGSRRLRLDPVTGLTPAR